MMWGLDSSVVRACVCSVFGYKRMVECSIHSRDLIFVLLCVLTCIRRSIFNLVASHSHCIRRDSFSAWSLDTENVITSISTSSNLSGLMRTAMANSRHVALKVNISHSNLSKMLVFLPAL